MIARPRTSNYPHKYRRLLLKPLHKYCYQNWVFLAAKVHWERPSIIGSVFTHRELGSSDSDVQWLKQDNTANKGQGWYLERKRHLASNPLPLYLPHLVSDLRRWICPIKTVIYSQTQVGSARVYKTALSLNHLFTQQQQSHHIKSSMLPKPRLLQRLSHCEKSRHFADKLLDLKLTWHGATCFVLFFSSFASLIFLCPITYKNIMIKLSP